MSNRHAPICRRARQRQAGLATLVVVAVLFFVASMVAAYANRNLIFEQRTATNQLRSTQAMEAAEGGVEWTLAMLNTGRITETGCTPDGDATLSTFRSRYLNIDASGLVTALPNMANTASTRAWPTCVQSASGWSCTCPPTTLATPAAPTGTGVAPAFRMRFASPLTSLSRPGTVWVQVNGCTRLEASCLNFPATSSPASVTDGDARVRLDVLVALKPALPSPPVAAVTVRGQLNVQGNLTAANPTRAGSGVAVMTGGVLAGEPNISLSGPAGTPRDPANLLLAQDATLSTVKVPSGDRFFSGMYAAAPADYRDQPAAIVIDCTATACSADRLRTLAVRNPGRVLWARGDVTLVGGANLGTPADPVLLVVEGNLTVTGITIHGLVHGRAADWTVSGGGATVRGALVAENNLSIGAGNDLTVVHDAAVLDALRTRYGSFVRVPGGWRDF